MKRTSFFLPFLYSDKLTHKFSNCTLKKKRSDKHEMKPCRKAFHDFMKCLANMEYASFMFWKCLSAVNMKISDRLRGVCKNDDRLSNNCLAKDALLLWITSNWSLAFTCGHSSMPPSSLDHKIIINNYLLVLLQPAMLIVSDNDSSVLLHLQRKTKLHRILKSCKNY